MTLVVGVLGATLLRLPEPAPDRVNTPEDLRPTPSAPSYVPSERPSNGVKPSAQATTTATRQRPTSTRTSTTVSGPVVTGPSKQADRPVRPPRPPDNVDRVVKPPMSRESFPSATACAPLTDNGGWCDSALATDTGGGHELEYRLCPVQDGTQSDEESVRYRSNIETDLKIVDSNGNTVWHWSRGQAVTPADYTVPVQRGYCLKWTVSWSDTDENGNQLPPGSYTLTAWSRAVGFENRAPAQATPFTIS